MKQDQAKNEIHEKWNELLSIFKQSFDVNKYKITIKADADLLYKIDVVKKGKKNTSSPFKISYLEDGVQRKLYSEKRKGAKILITFIKWVGIDKVYNLKIKAKRSGLLVSDNVTGNENNSPVQIGDKYVFTKSENEEKINQIQEIINLLKINATVERVDTNS